MKKQILFVTSLDEDSDEGLSYAIDLSKTMDKDIAILLVHKKNWLNKFEDMMSAIAFAEVNEHETARKLMEGNHNKAFSLDEKIRSLAERCNASGIDSVIQTVTADAVSAVLDSLKQMKGIDMILLSPSVTVNGEVTSKDLSRLVRIASRPVVTMSRQAYAV